MKTYILLFSMGILTTNLVAQETERGWYEISNPSNEILHDMYFLNKDTAYIIGTNGLIMSSFNNGDSWSEMNRLTTNRLYDIHFFSDQEGVIVGENGLVMRTVNKGITWSIVSEDQTYDFTQALFINSNEGYVLHRELGGASLLKTEDGGATWGEKLLGLEDYGFQSFINSMIRLKDGSILVNVTLVNDTSGFVHSVLYTISSSDEVVLVSKHDLSQVTCFYVDEDETLFFSTTDEGGFMELQRTNDNFKSCDLVYDDNVYFSFHDIQSIDSSYGWYIAVGSIMLSSTDGTDWINEQLYLYPEFEAKAIKILSENSAIYIANPESYGYGSNPQESKGYGKIMKTNSFFTYSPLEVSTKPSDTYGIQFYPNPTSDRLYVTNVEHNTPFVIYNSIGKLEFSDVLKNDLIDISRLTEGVFYLKFIFDDTQKTIRISKMN